MPLPDKSLQERFSNRYREKVKRENASSLAIEIRAVRIVGEHFILRSEEQLLMYLGGGAGTGKSYVIKAIVELFKRCGYSDELFVSGPMGCAAILIEGYTIHALTFLPKSDYPINQAELETIWKA
jgi:hypothetical protein